MRILLPSALVTPLLSAVGRLELNFDPRVGLRRVQRYGWQWKRDAQYAFLISIALFSLSVMPQPLIFKLFLVSAYTLGLLVPFTGQFVLPASPIFAWVILFFSSKYIPRDYRPHIWVSVLPTLESVLYGANISDLLTRHTNSFFDVVAWIPYGVLHFAAPVIVAGFIFVFSPPGAVKFWAATFGYVNITGVLIQIVFPCAPPWYELRDGLVPANYLMKGSPGGLARIDAIFGGHGYSNTFSNAPVPFGAFPSLHAGCATLEGLALSHFFPKSRPFIWAYVFVLYWSTMYLTHHYLIDLVAGGSLSVVFFYSFLAKLPDELRHPNGIAQVQGQPLFPQDPEAGHETASYGGWGGSIGEDDEEDAFELSKNGGANGDAFGVGKGV